MDVFIYFEPEENVNIGDLEDEIDKILGDKGEVTGSGMGISGGNIDVELFDKNILEDFLKELRELDFPQDAYYIIDGVRNKLF